MNLKLKNPIVFLDLETTGIDIVNDRIVELAFIKVKLDGSEEEKHLLINPEMPIPEETSKIHGIYDKDVADKPTFKSVAKSLAKFIEGCDWAGFASNRFDIPLLAEEFLRVGVEVDLSNRKFVDVQNIFHKLEARTFEAAVEFYTSKTLAVEATIENKVDSLLDIFSAQVDRYKETEVEEKEELVIPFNEGVGKIADFSAFNKNADFIGRIIYNEEGKETFNFGKFRGQTVEEVLTKQPSFYGWMMGGDFPLYTKKVLTSVRDRMKAEKAKEKIEKAEEKTTDSGIES